MNTIDQTPRPPNHLVLSIVATLCCCLPAGIVGIVYAAQVDSKMAGGDVSGAWAASKNAAMWSYISIGVGLAASVVYALAVSMGAIHPHHG